MSEQMGLPLGCRRWAVEFRPEARDDWRRWPYAEPCDDRPAAEGERDRAAARYPRWEFRVVEVDA